MIRALNNRRNRGWIPLPDWRRALAGALALLLAAISSYGEYLVEVEHELGAWGIRDITE